MGKIKNTTRKFRDGFSKYFPGANLLYLQKPSRSKLAAHIAWAVVGSFLYLGGGTYGAIQLPKYILKPSQEEVQKAEMFRDKLFGEDGYIDANKNGEIGINELEAFYARIGKEKHFWKSFPRISLGQLEEAVKSYESEIKDRE